MLAAGAALTMRSRAAAVGPAARTLQGRHSIRSNLLPAALAGGVVIAALVTLLLIGGGGGSGDGPMPAPVPAGAVRLFPSATPPAAPHIRRRHRGGSAAESQYAAGGDGGTVLTAP